MRSRSATSRLARAAGASSSRSRSSRSPSAAVRAVRSPAWLTPSSRPNVLLVTIDTLRADHVGSYGYHEASTPTIDALARRGVRFETAVAHAPLTGPSHASILTGQTPLGHGFRNNSGFILAPGVKTVAQDFRNAGYHTAGFVSGFPLDRRFGFDRGFETYDDRLPKGNDRRRTPYVERFADATTDAVLRWLATANPREAPQPAPWFLWVHYYDPHAPYEPPVADLADRYRQSPYDGEIAFVDRQLGRLLQTLDVRGETSRTIVLVTADHGESLGEHGEGTHGIFLYDATLRVPWIMAGPQIAAGRVSRTVARSIDVLPTLLDYAGLPQRSDVDGRSASARRRWRANVGCSGLRRVALRRTGAGLGPAACLADGSDSQVHQGSAPGAVRICQERSLRRRRIAPASRGAGQRFEQPARSGAAPTDAVGPGTNRSTRKPPNDCGRSAMSAEDAPHGPRARRSATPKTVFVFCRGSIAACPRRDRNPPELAIRELTSVLEEDPGLFMARRTRAVAYAAAGRHASSPSRTCACSTGKGSSHPKTRSGTRRQPAVRRPAGRSGPHPSTRRAREPDLSAALDFPCRRPHPGAQVPR